MLQRAYSVLTVKAVDTERRTFSGIATTPSPDRVGDIVEPKGARFKNPLPLILFHQHDQPVGQVRFGKPDDDGIAFEASIPDVKEPGRLKDRVDEAWHSVKYGVIRGVSIGFRAAEDGIELLKTGGLRFNDYEVVELSLVPVPANAEATITTIKSLDAPFLAASGTPEARPSQNTPGVSGTPVVRLKPARSEPAMKKSYAEQIAGLEAKRAANVARMEEIQTKATDEGRTKDESEREEWQNLSGEVKSIDAELVDLREMEAFQKSVARPVSPAQPHEQHVVRTSPSVIRVQPNEEPGIGFAKAVLCKTASFLSQGMASPLEFAKSRYPDNDRVQAYLKATVPAATTTHVTWAAPFVDPTNLTGEFLEFLRPMTILGNPALSSRMRRVPPNVRILGQTSGGDGYWVAEGAPKPLTKFDFNAQTLGFHKVAAIAVITEELARYSQPGAERIVRDSLAAAVRARVDVDFIDPTVAAVTGVNPASITNGVTPLEPSGTTADAARADVARIVKAYLDNNNSVTGLVLIMPASLALSLSTMRNSLGQREFADLGINGGTLEGIPVVTTQYAANQSGAGNLLIAVNAPDVLLADEGGVTVDASREASLQMLDNPTNSAATGTPTTMVSMWQTNSIALRAEWAITWAKARTNAVVYMDDVNWGSIGSPA